MTNTIIIGGGASGITAAITLRRKGQDVLILEKNSTCLKKLLATGNGRCNYLNEDFNLNHFHSSREDILKQMIKKEDKEKVIQFFNSIGIVPKIKKGYYYPYSNQASSIKNVLLKEAEILGVKIKVNTEVTRITKNKNQFAILTNNGTYIANKLVLATGSTASKIKGSDGDGYRFLKEMNLKIEKPLPALVPLTANEKFLKLWHGIRCDVSVKLIENNHLIKEEKGEAQLTKEGISGICIMQLSRYIARGIDHSKKERLEINFLPIYKDQQELINFLNDQDLILKNRSISDLLTGLLPNQLINILLDLSQINQNKRWKNLSKAEKERIVNHLMKFSIDITGTKSFDYAQVCTGGLSLTEVNPHTLESKKIKGLYIIGELLDIDGDCGGYNLSNAWVTGMKLGENQHD